MERDTGVGGEGVGKSRDPALLEHADDTGDVRVQKYAAKLYRNLRGVIVVRMCQDVFPPWRILPRPADSCRSLLTRWLEAGFRSAGSWLQASVKPASRIADEKVSQWRLNSSIPQRFGHRNVLNHQRDLRLYLYALH